MIDINDLKEYLKYSGNELDTFFTKIVDAVTEKMSAYCKRDLRYGIKYDVLNGELQNIIDLEKYPVERIVSIKYRDESNIPPGGGHNQFNNDIFKGFSVEDNIYLDKQNGKAMLLKGFQLPEGQFNIEVKYLAGYTVDAPDPECETPVDLKSVCLMSSAEFFLKSLQGDGRIGLHSRTKDIPDLKNKITEIYKDEDYSIILDRYKRIK